MDQRRKRVSLTIFQKVEILKKLQHGSSVKMIQEEYNVGKSTIYDLRSDKEKILQYAAECESANLMKNRKTMKPAKFDELDRVLYEWFKQRRSEGIPISGFILREKAREFHQTMDLEVCQFSDGWLKNFRKRYDIKHLKVNGKKNSADTEAAEKYVEVFKKNGNGGQVIAITNLQRVRDRIVVEVYTKKYPCNQSRKQHFRLEIK